MTDILEIKTVSVSAGSYPIGVADGTDSTNQPQHQVELTAFWISETVITNVQFLAFVEADGYGKSSYWTEMGWRWQQSKQVTAPAFWEDRRFNHDLQPVVGLCWYEAQAFVTWLAQHGEHQWRLPTEVEWEATARGNASLRWPPADTQRVNSAELGIRRTWAALGRGQRAWCGACDLCGNVWEWTASGWGRNWQTLDYRYPYLADDGREDLQGSMARVMRGGSWFDPLAAAHPAHRGRYLPGSRGSNIGFRIAYSA